MDEKRTIYRKVRGDIAPFTFEWAVVECGKVVSSGLECLFADFADNPLKDDWAGATEEEIQKTFDAPEVAQKWLSAWMHSASR